MFFRLKEELSASSALTQNLKADLQRKEEDYFELKEKLADAKKQIEQVQKEVGYLKSCVASLNNKDCFHYRTRFLDTNFRIKQNIYQLHNFFSNGKNTYFTKEIKLKVKNVQH